MRAKYRGRAVVLALVLLLILSLPVLARRENIVVDKQKQVYDSWDYYVQYQWVMEGMESRAHRYLWVIIPPGPDSGECYAQYQ